MILQTVKDVAAFMIILIFALLGFCLMNILVNFDNLPEGLTAFEFSKALMH